MPRPQWLGTVVCPEHSPRRLGHQGRHRSGPEAADAAEGPSGTLLRCLGCDARGPGMAQAAASKSPEMKEWISSASSRRPVGASGDVSTRSSAIFAPFRGPHPPIFTVEAISFSTASSMCLFIWEPGWDVRDSCLSIRHQSAPFIPLSEYIFKKVNVLE